VLPLLRRLWCRLFCPGLAFHTLAALLEERDRAALFEAIDRIEEWRQQQHGTASGMHFVAFNTRPRPMVMPMPGPPARRRM
jgi:hypothetical protein